MNDVASRLVNRIQLTTDGFTAYREAVGLAWYNVPVDYAMPIKQYEATNVGPGRYSPPVCIACYEEADAGRAGNLDHVSTSYVERQNLTMGHADEAVHTAHERPQQEAREPHPFARDPLPALQLRAARHETLRKTPAMKAGLSKGLWSIEDMVKLWSTEDHRRGDARVYDGEAQ